MKSNIRSRPRILFVTRCIAENDKGKFLIIKRILSELTNAGLWEFPGGKLDIGQDVSHAIEREFMEETGLLVKVLSPLVFMDSIVVGVGKYKGLPYVIATGKGVVLSGTLRLSSEHIDFKWVSKKDALTMDLTEDARKAILALL